MHKHVPQRGAAPVTDYWLCAPAEAWTYTVCSMLVTGVALTGRQPEMDAEGPTAFTAPAQRLALQPQGLRQAACEMAERLRHEAEGQLALGSPKTFLTMATCVAKLADWSKQLHQRIGHGLYINHSWCKHIPGAQDTSVRT
jgi:hypothetical protein